MKGISLSGRQFWALTILLIFLSIMPLSSKSDEMAYSSALPIIMAPPGVLIVHDEDTLREAIEIANSANQLPRIEFSADVELTTPLPMLFNPGTSIATIDGNGHKIDGNRLGSVLAIGSGTNVIIQNIVIINGSGNRGVDAVCGGGIYNAGRLTLRQTQVSNNWARRGGGICTMGNSILTLEDTIISDNLAYSLGGGIYAHDKNVELEVNIIDSLLQGNHAQDVGGAIYAFAADHSTLNLNVHNSTLTENSGVGAAIFSTTFDGTIYTNISHSTITFNEAPRGSAGMSNSGSSYFGGQALAIIKNSTFSGNVSFDNGGAILNYDYEIFPLNTVVGGRAIDVPTYQEATGGAYMQLLYSTVSENRANRGSGIWNEGQLESLGSIIAHNEENGRNCWQPILSNGYNLDSDDSCGFNQPTDIPHGQADLQPLALVPPGDTFTHALGPHSEALDRIPTGELGCDPATDTDQRGVIRPQPIGGLCDIGAFEVENP